MSKLMSRDDCMGSDVRQSEHKAKRSGNYGFTKPGRGRW